MKNRIPKMWYERTCGECWYWKHAKVNFGEPCERVMGGRKRTWNACNNFREGSFIPERTEVLI